VTLLSDVACRSWPLSEDDYKSRLAHANLLRILRSLLDPIPPFNLETMQIAMCIICALPHI
jgi:hypothetical protein